MKSEGVDYNIEFYCNDGGVDFGWCVCRLTIGGTHIQNGCENVACGFFLRGSGRAVVECLIDICWFCYSNILIDVYNIN